MKTTNQILTVIALLGLTGSLGLAEPPGTAFSYQGRLLENGLPGTGTYDLRRTLWDQDTGDCQWFLVLTNAGVPIDNQFQHIGPMAQDFHATFGVGDSTRTEHGRGSMAGAKRLGVRRAAPVLEPAAVSNQR
jgi:hypothetical protein